MGTVVINAYSNAFPLITNRVRADISTQVSPLAIIASRTEDAPHPVRLWSFPGLPRTNYVIQLNEIDSFDNPVRQLAYFDIVPGNIDSGIFRADEQIKVGVTPGLNEGATSFTFDGTETSAGSGVFKPDYRNWEISIEEYSGVSTLIRGKDYSWDKATGIFALLQSGDELAVDQWYTVKFQPQTGGAGGSTPTVFDFEIRFITTDTLLDISDFGKKIIIEPAGDYLEITLPSIATIVDGRYLMFETRSAQVFKCVKIIPQTGDIMAFMFGNLYMMMNEKLYLYKVTRSGGVYEFRICNESGNFINCGNIVANDLLNVFNKMPLDGGGLDGLDKFQFARLYNEVVLRLGAGQVVNYDNWSINKTLWSFANSTDPSMVDKFRIPDRRGLTQKYNPVGRLIGSFEESAIGPHQHAVGFYGKGRLTFGGDEFSLTADAPNAPGGLAPLRGTVTAATGFGISSETKVKNYSTNQFILV